ncbi:hypothetical protein [Pedosphaera parvula]
MTGSVLTGSVLAGTGLTSASFLSSLRWMRIIQPVSFLALPPSVTI